MTQHTIATLTKLEDNDQDTSTKIFPSSNTKPLYTMVKQTELRKDHSKWKCKARLLGQACDGVNYRNEMECSNCGKRRAANTEALNKGDNMIGLLESVDSQGKETWEYYDPQPH